MGERWSCMRLELEIKFGYGYGLCRRKMGGKRRKKSSVFQRFGRNVIRKKDLFISNLSLFVWQSFGKTLVFRGKFGWNRYEDHLNAHFKHRELD